MIKIDFLHYSLLLLPFLKRVPKIFFTTSTTFRKDYKFELSASKKLFPTIKFALISYGSFLRVLFGIISVLRVESSKV